MREVDDLEAEDRLGELLDLVEEGEEVVILRGGRRVARLVREEHAKDRAAAAAAAERIRARARARREASVSLDEWKAFRDDGRP